MFAKLKVAHLSSLTYPQRLWANLILLMRGIIIKNKLQELSLRWHLEILLLRETLECHLTKTITQSKTMILKKNIKKKHQKTINMARTALNSPKIRAINIPEITMVLLGRETISEVLLKMPNFKSIEKQMISKIIPPLTLCRREN